MVYTVQRCALLQERSARAQCNNYRRTEVMFKSRRLSGSLAAALFVLSLAPAGSALAAPSGQTGATVVASGLASPRGLDAGDDGNLYVAESGSGGTETFTVGEG